MQRSIASSLLSLLIGLELLLSCSTTTLIPPSVKRPDLPHDTTKISVEAGWLPHQTIGSREYFIRDSSIISISTDTSQTRSSETNTFYSLSVSQFSNSLVVKAKVDSVTTTSQSPSLKSPLNADTARGFQATISPTGQVFSLPRDSTPLCLDGVRPRIARIYELLIIYPSRMLKVGDSWTDTVSTTVCRGKISLLQQAIRNYKILSFTTWHQQSAVTIKRIVSASFSTDFKQTQNHFDTKGSGESSALIYVNQVTGVLLQSDTQSELTFTISTGRGVFPFRQIISTHIELH